MPIKNQRTEKKININMHHHGHHHGVHGHIHHHDIHHHGIHHGHGAHIGAGAHHHRTIIYPPFQPKPDQVLALDIDGDNDKFGCATTCGCTPNVAKIPRQYHVPLGAEDLITVEDLNVLADEVNRILETNYIPPFPLIFLHFCLPFSPICIMGSYSSKKQKALQELLEVKNATMKNCHW